MSNGNNINTGRCFLYAVELYFWFKIFISEIKAMNHRGGTACGGVAGGEAEDWEAVLH